MKFTDWTAKGVEERILEMAEALRLSPGVKGPREFGNAMPSPVRPADEGYGYSPAYYRKNASAGALSRMSEAWDWINALPEMTDRKLMYAWSFVKVRKGMKIAAFAAENDMNDRMLRRSITKLCQHIANDLNRKAAIRLTVTDLQVSENQRDIASSTVTSESRVNHWRDKDAKPQIDPAQRSRRVLDHRESRERQ
ncbi:hypothetical protein [Rhizobium sp. Leaf383]|uniref:hypothetical protein n=1 Tax=Rhizobium sp. Leaf383 TaxID=1736357 RepID=UPI00071590D9|nr:hypothetical protein [Rhizobium sp. Leaf383]KQS83435.1 hypothetical protein ASG58_22135 [Rhizobium sp. Leaf383]